MSTMSTMHPVLLQRRPHWLALTTAALLALAQGAHAADDEYQLTLKNHRFEPRELKVPAGKRVKLLVHNQDATPEEFESHALNREKVVPAGAKVTIFIGPLKAGRYEFYGEYNPTSAQGVVLAE